MISFAKWVWIGPTQEINQKVVLSKGQVGRGLVISADQSWIMLSLEDGSYFGWTDRKNVLSSALEEERKRQ